MSIALIEWDDVKNEYDYSPVEAAGVSFMLGNDIIEINQKGEEIVVRTIHGRLVIEPDVSNQIKIRVVK